KHKQRQPLLLPTLPLQTTQYISNLLKNPPITHHLLNPKNHHPQPQILPNPPQKPPLTIPTNIPPPATHIKLAERLQQ
uniref:preprotein translocase subunit SecA n=1 Tax=Staphylococcus haemolyticus TaxID=1283 RepID=UPI00374E32C8